MPSSQEYLLRHFSRCTDELESAEDAIEAIDSELRALNEKAEQMIRDGEEYSYYWRYCTRRKRILREHRARHEATSREMGRELVSTFSLQELNDFTDRVSPSPSSPRCLDDSRFFHSSARPSRADLLDQANRCLDVWQSSLDAIEVIDTDLRALNKKAVKLIQGGRKNSDYWQELGRRNAALRENRARHDALGGEMAQEFYNTWEEVVKMDSERNQKSPSPSRRRRRSRRDSLRRERVNRR